MILRFFTSMTNSINTHLMLKTPVHTTPFFYVRKVLIAIAKSESEIYIHPQESS